MLLAPGLRMCAQIFCQNAILAQPSRASQRPRDNALGMFRDEFQRDHAAHRITDYVSLSNVQTIEQQDHVIDPLLAIGRGIVRFVGLAIPRQIDCYDLMIPWPARRSSPASAN